MTQPNDKPSIDEVVDPAVDVAGTDTGNPIAGLELDRENTPEVVSGDTGPEGNRQTGLAPPIQ